MLYEGRRPMAKLTKPARDRISTSKFACPKQRKEPLENASHVRNAVARFNQVKGVTEAELVRRGSESSRPQNDMEWNSKSPTSANTRLPWQRERDGSTMGVWLRSQEWLGAARERGPFFRNEVLVVPVVKCDHTSAPTHFYHDM